MTAPKISCIVTAYNEGPLAEVALRSLLAQSYEDFEVLLVDDGASDQTRAVLHSFDDPRIVHLRQWNDGLSSARNRALQHARGTYVCFLDADDSRPAWAFERQVALAEATDADCVFSPGLLVEKQGIAQPFYDTDILSTLRADLPDGGVSRADDKAFPTHLAALALAEPQVANKFVKRALLETRKIRFPSGQFFEDMIVHNAILQAADSVAVLDMPSFTYFQRYGRPQITGTASLLRFDAITVAANALTLFAASPRFQYMDLRVATLAATFKLLEWCESCVSHVHRYSYQLALQSMAAQLDGRYTIALETHAARRISSEVPWAAGALAYFKRAATTTALPNYAATGGVAAPVMKATASDML